MIPSFLKNVPEHIIDSIQDVSLDVPSENCNQAINELLKKTVLLGGKRLRPLLTYLMSDLFSSPPVETNVCAASIEMVHAASLSHDDVIDEATVRRGLPAINSVAGNKKAVLAGDYLLAGVIGNLTKLDNLALVKEMSDVIASLAEGEWIQLDTSLNRNYSRELISLVAFHKTASVMSWCCVSSAITSEVATEENRDELIDLARKLGVHLGHAFQLWDDTLDFSGSSQKDENLDLDNDIVNAVVFEWLSTNEAVFTEYKNGVSLNSLVSELTNENLEHSIAKVKAEASFHLNKCRDLLKAILNKLPGDGGELERKSIPIYDILDYLEQRSH
jgi:geranylgeranyl pyrophosphate synthase